jgi:thioredoxin 1
VRQAEDVAEEGKERVEVPHGDADVRDAGRFHVTNVSAARERAAPEARLQWSLVGEQREMSNAIAVTDADFETQVEKHSGVTVVDFWATWCGPCRMIAPILDQLAVEYQGKVRVAKLDVDSNQKTAMRFNVRSIPALLFFKDGKLVDQVIGAVPKAALSAKFAQHSA